MFESAELGHEIDKARYEREAPKLRAALLAAELELVEKKDVPVIILVNGVDGAGKGETVNLLNEWMDPRHIQAHAFGPPTDEERERPPMWRFWRRLPPKGKLGIFFGNWYTDPIVSRATGATKNADLDRAMEDAVRFERMLTNEGALIVKLWFHLSKKRQKKVLERLEKDPATRWRVTKEDWKNHERYDEYRAVSERALRASSTANAPWLIVEGFDARYRNLTVAKTLRDAMKARATAERPPVRVNAPPSSAPLDKKDLLRALDLSKSLPEKKYDAALAKEQARLNALTRSLRFRKIAVSAVFEGNDAAGKGGAIRRVTRAMDARQYDVVPIAAPTEEERAQPYLWRFWRHLPRRGKVAIFDRSWYGRVLVERVEGFAAEADWTRAYGEINDFEQQLVDHRIVVVKFWLAISPEEQLARFEAREKTSFKRFKITEEDWRNRKKAGAYEIAVCDMVDRTSTDLAPWHLVEANDKRYARIKVIRTLGDAIEAAL